MTTHIIWDCSTYSYSSNNASCTTCNSISLFQQRQEQLDNQKLYMILALFWFQNCKDNNEIAINISVYRIKIN